VPLLTTPTAKLHLRVDTSDEDDLIAIWIGVAEQQVAHYLNRNVYADQGALDAAVAAAPADLADATTAYEAAILAADAMEEGVGKAAAAKYAEEAYALAQDTSDRTQRGMVVNDTVKAALLLTIGNLYEHRGEDADELPRAVQSLLNPYRVGMGV
jgi:hypothetical protein